MKTGVLRQSEKASVQTDAFAKSVSIEPRELKEA